MLNELAKHRSLAVIPARGGSKGVPGKNIRLLSDKPLIAYTIEAAIQSNLFDHIIVSTDSEEIAEVSRKYGAEVPFLRPDDLSGDAVSSDAVVLHALEYYEMQGEKFDTVCKLQPTSPLRAGKHIIEAYNLLLDKDSDYVVSVCECEHSPLWSGVLGPDNSMDSFMEEQNKSSCRQYLPKYYRLNGAIYIAKVELYQKNRNFLGKNATAYIMEQEDSIDIDSILDFEIAEFLINKFNKFHK